MAYSQFTYKKIRAELGITNRPEKLFAQLVAVMPSDWLVHTIEMNLPYALYSEKARSEGIVFPILAELCRNNAEKVSLYSGAILNVEEKRGLNGECDFILSSGIQDFELNAPLFCVIEAEDNDIEKNIPQCIAQMEGARTYNEKETSPTPIIYGCVTTATEWQFLKLQDKTCFIDKDRYYIDKLENILGALQAIVNVYDLKEG